MSDYIKMPIIPAKADGTPQNDGLSYCSHGAGWSGGVLGVPIVPGGHGTCIKAGLMPEGPPACKWNDDFSGGLSRWTVLSGDWAISSASELECSVLSFADNGFDWDSGRIRLNAVIASGDFDVQISIHADSSYWVQFDFALSGGGAEYRIRWETDDQDGSELAVDGGGCSDPVYDISAPTLLRWVREGTVLSGYYNGGLIGSCSHAAVSSLSTVELYWESYTGASIYIDDLKWAVGCPP